MGSRLHARSRHCLDRCESIRAKKFNSNSTGSLGIRVGEAARCGSKKRQGQRTDLKPHFQETIPESDKGQARDKAAEMVGANRQYVSDAKKIEHDAPEILDHVKQGMLSIPQAKQMPAAQCG
jgi:hypothetical protein